MKAKGVTFLEDPRYEEYGTVVVFKDLVLLNFHDQFWPNLTEVIESMDWVLAKNFEVESALHWKNIEWQLNRNLTNLYLLDSIIKLFRNIFEKFFQTFWFEFGHCTAILKFSSDVFLMYPIKDKKYYLCSYMIFLWPAKWIICSYWIHIMQKSLLFEIVCLTQFQFVCLKFH